MSANASVVHRLCGASISTVGSRDYAIGSPGVESGERERKGGAPVSTAGSRGHAIGYPGVESGERERQRQRERKRMTQTKQRPNAVARVRPLP
ncbi:hypothetical protein [Mycolicibacterium porcinum]|uniref:hypothetical protein n=1 Tax=Mycolicibacterium porcinum TaxID=39693 RepID=UPI0010427175|nr:hypothetical protein [Mycolicibacterium porcinum]